MQSHDGATIIRDFDQMMLAEAQAEDAKVKTVLELVRAKVSPEVFADIQACIEDSGAVYDFKMEKKPLGTEQDDGYSFGPYFVNQTCNGGMTGDDFAGTVSIPLNSSEWLQFAYSM